MLTKKKTFWNIVFLIVVFALTVYGVFRGEDLDSMMEAIREADVKRLIPGVILVLFFIWGESIILWYMMRSFQIRVKKRICFLFSSVGFFFSCITPSATGGQPMQVFYMKKEKIPVPVATVILMVVTITYKLVLVVMGVGIACFGRGFMHRYMEEVIPVFYLGVLLNVFCVGFMTVLVFHPDLAEKILTKGMRLLEKLRFIRHKEERGGRLRESMEIYRETALYLRNHPGKIMLVILITFVQRLALFAVTWLVYRSFGLTGTPVWDVIVLQAVISISVDMLPLPGGMGISEALFLKIFPSVFGAMTLPAMVLSRGMGYYSELLLSAFFTLAAQVYYMVKARSEQKDQAACPQERSVE